MRPAPTLAASVLLVGNPNVGKSTLFNAVTGARQHTVNAPGTTVELERGVWRTTAGDMAVTDLPGTYSLIARSPDERVVAHAIAEAGPGTVVVVALDATGLSRSLYVLAQVAEHGLPVVGALTMNDVATGQGHPASAADLSRVLGVPVVEVDATHRRGLASLGRAVVDATTRPAFVLGVPRREAVATPTAPGTESLEAARERAGRLFDWVGRTLATVGAHTTHRRTPSDAIDAVLLNPWTGVPVFLAVAWLLFELATKITAPLVQGVTAFAAGPVDHALSALLADLGVGGGWFEDFLTDGLLVGIATVASFVPVLALVFTALGALEASGYMARAAVVADRAMRIVGLDGRAVLPLMVGFGCNVPALGATRALPDSRQRLLTGLLIPFTACSARLAVFIVLAQTFFPNHAGHVVFLLYCLSIALIVAVGALLRLTIMRGTTREPLALVLPAYQWPRLGAVVRGVWRRIIDFVVRAGALIVGALVVLWLLAAIPVRGGHTVGDVPIEDSLYGAGSRALAPVLAPMGLDDWRIAASAVSGFVAKEVTVGTLAQAYARESTTGATLEQDELSALVRATVSESSGGEPAAAGFAFMVLVLASTPCLATVAEQRRLFGWKWAGMAVGMHLVLGWILATLAFQLGRLL